MGEGGIFCRAFQAHFRSGIASLSRFPLVRTAMAQSRDRAHAHLTKTT